MIVTEFVKLVLAAVLYFYSSRGSTEQLRSTVSKGVYFAVPAFMYAILNNLQYIVLLSMDAGTFWVLYNLRILSSGVLSQLIFNRPLGQRKWGALFLLVVGCVIHQYSEKFTIDRLWPLFLIAVQCLLSSLSGVYNEYLFKKDSSLDTNLQNMWLYSLTILFNLLFLLFKEPKTLFSPTLFFAGYNNFYCFAAIALTAFGGYLTALILKYLSAIMKEYGSALVMLASTLGTVYILKEKELKMNQILSILIVGISLYVYKTAPSPPAPSELPDTDLSELEEGKT